jgi:CHAT domain-containing protein
MSAPKRKLAPKYLTPAASVTRQRVARPLKIVLPLLIAACAGLGAWWQFLCGTPADEMMLALQASYRDARPLEARISGFEYAPFVTLRGGPAGGDKARAPVERMLFADVDDEPPAGLRRARGSYYLAERKYDLAIGELNAALQADEQNAGLHNDLGVALFCKGLDDARGGDASGVEALAQGLAHLNRALAYEPHRHEALFNRALLRQKMMLAERAAQDWRAYLEKDSNSPWAAEARQNLGRLEDRQRLNEQGHRDLLDNFLNSCRSKDAERAWALFSPNRERLTTELLAAYLNGAAGYGREALDALAYAGKLDVQRAGDHYAADVARFYRSASLHRLAAARRAWELMGQAKQYYSMAWGEKAAELRGRARQIFSQIGDECGEQLATYWLALHYWEMGRTQQSRSLFDPLLRSCEASRHDWLRARVLYQQATVAFKFDEHSNAISYYGQSQDLADKVNDSQCRVDSTGGLIEKYRLLGNKGECFAQVVKGWPLLDVPSLGPMPLWRYFNFMAMAFAAFGLHDAAIECAHESLRFASAANNYTTLSYSHAHLGLMYGKARNFEQAFGNVDRAYELAASNADKAFGQVMMAYAAVQKGHLHQQRGEFAEALGRYDHAVELHGRHALDFSTHLYQAYKGRLACYTALNDTPAAQQQFATLLELMDKHRAEIAEEENRDNFFDAEQSVYDLGIDLAYSRMRDWELSFAYAEASRARSLLESMSTGAQVIERGGKLALLLQAAAKPLTLAEIRARIADDTRLLQYAVLDNKLLVWIVSRDGAQAVTVPVSQAALTDAVERFLAALRGTSDAEREEASRVARELFGHLISPVEAEAGGCRKLVIVPDKALNRLPWDALVSPASNDYLLDDYVVTLAPSATLFALCTDLAGQKAAPRDENILSVGNPRFDAGAFPELDDLDGAELEAEKIAGLYSSPNLLTGPEASESAVRDGLARADVAHFALHCVINRQSALRSCLVLAKERTAAPAAPKADAQLQAHEIYELKLPRMRVAVLSACQTGVEHYYRGEGMIGMARAFLVARVPLVVASLWPVDSDATAELMIRFHQYRKSNPLPTAEALWLAKRSLRQQPRYTHPMHWAAFQVIGGRANF